MQIDNKYVDLQIQMLNNRNECWDEVQFKFWFGIIIRLIKAQYSMPLFPSSIQTLLEVYDQPFFKKPPFASQNLLLQEQLADWVHQIYFEQKKLNDLSVLRLIDHPLQVIKPNITCSIMYSIIRSKVQQVCKSIRQLIIDSYRKLLTRKQTNSDLKHSTDSWNVNFSKFRKANLQTSMNKVYGPIAHILCTYHNSLLDSNKEVYDLWKLLYECSDVKDLQFKTLQGSLNQLILEELMKDYPTNQLTPKEVLPTLSTFEKNQFIFKEMWGFQKRKLAVQFHAKIQQPVLIQKQRTNSLMRNPNLPRKIEKGQILSPPKPIPLSLKQMGVSTTKFQLKIDSSKFTQKQLAKKKAMQEQIHFMQLEQQFSKLDPQTRMKILQHLYEFKRQSLLTQDKSENLQTIQKLFINNLSDKQKTSIIENHLLQHSGEPIEIELDDGSESDDEDQNFFYDDDRNHQEEQLNQQLQVKFELKRMNDLQREITHESHAQMIQDFQNEHFDPKETSHRYREVCQRLQLIREAFKKAKFQFNDRDSEKLFSITPSNSNLSLNQEKLPDLIPINIRKTKSQSTDQKQISQLTQKAKLNQSKLTKEKQKQKEMEKFKQKEKEKQRLRQRSQKLIDPIYNFKLQQDSQNQKKQCLYQKLKKFYEAKAFQELSNDDQQEKQEKSKNKKSKKQSENQIYFGRNVPISALAQLISDKGKSISHTVQSFSSNNKLSSKLQKVSRQQILDQIYQVAKQKQKRGHNLRMTYKKISYELKGGEEKNQIKITEGSFTTDDLNWIEDLPEKTKYNLSQSTDFGEKLIDEPCEDICQDEKPEKKKKKKKKKKNKQKKEQSESNDNNFDKASTSSFNDDEQDLQTLQQFKKRSIYDLLKLRKMMNWSEGQSIQQYLEASEMMQRQKEQQLLMQKKIEIYEKNGEKQNQKSGQGKALSKQQKIKKQNYNQDELKLFQFLQNLEIKDENREKCIVTEETLQRILYKRMQIKSMQLFKKHSSKNQINALSNQKDTENSSSHDLSNPKNAKPKNKKKKK